MPIAADRVVMLTPTVSMNISSYSAKAAATIAPRRQISAIIPEETPTLKIDSLCISNHSLLKDDG